jgi:hypothetical protein
MWDAGQHWFWKQVEKQQRRFASQGARRVQQLQLKRQGTAVDVWTLRRHLRYVAWSSSFKFLCRGRGSATIADPQ